MNDEGESWSEPSVFLKSDAGGLFYFNIRKMLLATDCGPREFWFFALYGHPRISKDHTIRSGIFDEEGWLLDMDLNRTNMNLFSNGNDNSTKNQLTLSELATVYESPENTTVRLLEVSPTLPFRIGLCTFKLNDAQSAVYRIASYTDGKWLLSAPIAKAGAFLAPEQLDGSQTYVGGMALYYVAGEAGIYKPHGGK